MLLQLIKLFLVLLFFINYALERSHASCLSWKFSAKYDSLLSLPPTPKVMGGYVFAGVSI